jgi:RNA polymerase sigma factor (sigma-70 family)
MHNTFLHQANQENEENCPALLPPFFQKIPITRFAIETLSHFVRFAPPVCMMRFEESMANADFDDASLVGACLKGDRDAFARIVARYHSLVASIAYSATGSISQSEDLAQETFVAAWRHLKSLEQPAKLRGWLCGIARRATANALRRQQREPAQDAEPIEEIMNAPAAEALPADQAISREEEAILWRSLEKIPETYREPLILFYRQGQSVQCVAEELGLSCDAVRQRLSRGRRLLEDQVASFVEGALRQSAPGGSFTAGVMSILPAQMASAGFASLSATAAKGGAAKAAGFFASLACLTGFLPGLVSFYTGYNTDIALADSDAGRRGVKRFYALAAVCVLVPVAFIFLDIVFRSMAAAHPARFVAMTIVAALSWLPCAAILLAALQRKPDEAMTRQGTKSTALEWRSKTAFLGLPLAHLRYGGSSSERRRPVKAWIAIGDVAFGGLFACGGIAVAPICFGGFCLGAVVFGGYAVGILTYAGFGLGAWAIGGSVMGLFALGGIAVGWTASVGAVAIARQFAVGSAAVALHANDALANSFVQSAAFFQTAYPLATRWLLPTMLAATLPSLVLSLAMRRRMRRVAQT